MKTTEQEVLTSAGAGIGAAKVPLERQLLRLDVEAFNTDYCHVLDDGDLQDWPEFFTEDGLYSITSRENFDADLPVGLVYCEGKGMMRDRAYAIAHTAMYAPRYLRHLVTNIRVVEVHPDGAVEATANYLLLETLHDNPKASIHQAGSYRDLFVRRDDGRLLLRKRICVYDTLLVPNALVLPV